MRGWFGQGHSELRFLDGFLRVIAQVELKPVALESRIKWGEPNDAVLARSTQPGKAGSDFFFLRRAKLAVAVGQRENQFLPGDVRTGTGLVQQAVEGVAALVLLDSRSALPVEPGLQDALQLSLARHQTAP